MTIVTINGTEHELRPPRSLAVRYSVGDATAQNLLLACGSALGLCLHGDARPKAQLGRYRGDHIAHGSAVIDELLERGCSMTEVRAAALVALSITLDGLYSEEEVKAAEDFSGAEEASTTT